VPEDAGRVLIGHGVDDSLWRLVNVVDTATDAVIVPNLEFGAPVPPTPSDSFDIPADKWFHFGFDVSAARFPVLLPAGRFTIVVPVDADTRDESVALRVYAIADIFRGQLRPREPL